MHYLSSALALSAASLVTALPQYPSTPDQYPSTPTSYPKNGGESSEEANQRANAVKEAFEFSWAGYYEYAFPNDELYPVTNGFGNSRNGWGASAADALSTALIMGEKEIVNQILDYVPSINWAVSSEDSVVSLFETTIRYLGGLLSGYDLLSGPLADLAEDDSKVASLLDQAQNLANNLSFAFDTPTGIPYNNIYVGSRSNDGDEVNGLATLGTLILEWQRLSDLTGDATYGDLASRAESYALNPQPAQAEPFPGLVGSSVSIANGSFTDARGAWTGGTDSFYEYLIKMYVYDTSRFSTYKDRWVLAADSSIEFLASHPSSRPDLTFLSDYNGRRLINSSQHLACFDGGNFILGGIVLGEQKYIDFGLQLVESCEDTYSQTLTKIGPEAFSWNSTAVPANQTEFYERAGFFITSSAYILRPEVIESFYYAYRATGDRKYQDYAWNAFVAINETCRTGSGFSSIEDVNAPGGGGFDNFQESFWFAEVLKYSYLIHAPEAEWQVSKDGKNLFVYNTEAHPVKVAGTPV
ncbi:Putative glycoside hydrolase family 47, six-hairpin glycosidase-like superfamily [Septoria linicola]|uniref:alpha-1,2-Mannosidase n=1 Tax=Septoria linicola TaxID=215465 RepID=A0A9Q9AXL1_9PEZI|nr:Putative glycoside hydrolase family 47, six-hairpin glycosidase-like superfamily [Septoria linicola]